MVEDCGSDREESTELFSCSLRNSWEGREGRVAVVSVVMDR